MNLDTLQSLVKKELEHFEKHFREAMRSQVPLLDKITYYIVKRKGKQIRPMFVFLSAQLVGKTTEASYHGASLIEMLHTATLVHDDVVDDAFLRRGFFSINALWKNKIAVLVGDYLLSKGLLLAIENNQFELLRIMSEAVKEMSEGELLQIEKARRLDIEESVYYEVIRKKTASLIGAACAAGACSAGASVEQIARIKEFGLAAGMAFQIKDDLFDFGEDFIGKPLGIDIKEKKMTLPLIYALSNCDSGMKRRMLKLVAKERASRAEINEVISFVKSSGGMDYASSKMFAYREEALTILDQFEANEAAKSLRELLFFVTDRLK